MSRNDMTPSEVRQDSVWGGWVVGVITALTTLVDLEETGRLTPLSAVFALVFALAVGWAAKRLCYAIYSRLWGLRR